MLLQFIWGGGGKVLFGVNDSDFNVWLTITFWKEQLFLLFHQLIILYYFWICSNISFLLQIHRMITSCQHEEGMSVAEIKQKVRTSEQQIR